MRALWDEELKERVPVKQSERPTSHLPQYGSLRISDGR